MGLFGDDEPAEETADGEEAADPLLDEGDDDLLDGGDDMSFGDMDEEGGGGPGNAELENRMDELENEVGSLSSTVNTVKSENEQISESVDDIEENIRKLLEVYEMVTRGVNPFVNEDDLGGAFDGGGGGSAGDGASLFGGDEGGDDEALDDSVAGADAEDFFDEDLGEDGFDDGMDEFGGEGDGFDDGTDGFDDEGDGFDDGTDGFDDEGGDAGGDEGKSFEELKAEYDAGQADWNEPAVDAGETLDAPDTGPAEMAGGGMNEAVVDDPAEMAGGVADGAVADDPVGMAGGGADEAVADSGGGGDTPNTGEPPGTPRPDGTGGDGTTPDEPSAGGRPHLDALPDGYAGDLVVMEWLEFLVDHGGVDGAARTVAYYESVGWLGEAAAEDLQTYLSGFGDAGEVPDPETIDARSPLSVECHRTSLRYVSRLSSTSMGMDVLDRLDEGGSPRPEADVSPAPDWAASNGADAAAPAPRAAGDPTPNGRAPPAEEPVRTLTWEHPSDAVPDDGNAREPAPEGRTNRVPGADDGLPPDGRRGGERSESDVQAGELTDDHTDE